MRPSLFTLFKRGRYFRLRSDEGAADLAKLEGEIQEKERFTVAAIAFCLNHDPVFLSYFLRRICDEQYPGNISALEIQIEPHSWCDLQLHYTNARGEFILCVIEVKISAQLQTKQDFTSADFQKRGGYGHNLCASWLYEESLLTRYVILGCDRPLEGERCYENGKLVCRQKSWQELTAKLPQTPLCRDMADCLGRLGIDEFKYRRTSNMRFGDELAKAADAWIVLEGVRAQLNVQRKYTRPDISAEDDGHWHFGWEILPKDAQKVVSGSEPGMATVLALTRLVQPRDGQATVWYGFEHDDRITRPSVWFYCGDEAICEQMKASLPKSFKADSTKDHYVSVFRSAKGNGGDQGWFLSVLQAILTGPKKG